MERSCKTLILHRKSQCLKQSNKRFIYRETNDEMGSYPPFMERESGRRAQQRVWDETRRELEGKVPEVKSIYEMLHQQADTIKI